MSKLLVRTVVLLSFLCSAVLDATTSELRSPLGFVERGPTHIYLDNAYDTWWTNDAATERYCEPVYCGLNFDIWTGGYSRSACEAFFKTQLDCDGDIALSGQSVTHNTAPLSTLFFGTNNVTGSFTLGQAFPGGSITCPPPDGVPSLLNPIIDLAKITPRFTYDEKGVFFGAQVWYQLPCAPSIRIGGRTSIPFKVINIQQNTSDGSATEQSLSDFIIQVPLDVGDDASEITYDWAFRLDFLTCLVRPRLAEGAPRYNPLVQYSINPSAPIQSTLISSPVGFADKTLAPVYVIKRTDGTLPPRVPLANPATPPTFAFAKQAVQVVGQLPADGSGVNNAVYNFGPATVNYAGGLGKNQAAQGTLFVVPHIEPDGNDVDFDAKSILNAITPLLATLPDVTAIGTLVDFGVDLTRAECIVGQGDWRLEFLAGYHPECFDTWYGWWYADGVFGVTVPTGKRAKNALDVFYQTTGNNGHPEVKIGLEAAWKPCNWFALGLDTSYNHVFNRTEYRAAPFTGATIRNIGPQIEANVKWHYFIFRLDANFFHPCNPDLGIDVGYELYAKSKDNVSICGGATATTFFGTTATLNADILENQTNTLTNKLRGEVFYRCHFFEIFAGASEIVTGRNAMKESEAHIGFVLYF